MNILLTNDDGIYAAGIRSLYKYLSKRHNVVVIAPESEQSGVGHGFTYNRPLSFSKVVFDGINMGYSVTGTPSDCVKLGITHILDTQPDVVISGINNGSNTGLAIFYSGTVAAAREAAFWNIGGIAFSLCDNGMEYLDSYAEKTVDIINKLSKNDMARDKHIFYNVNFPACQESKSLGIAITRQSLSFYDDHYDEVIDGDTKKYQLKGTVKDVELTNFYDTRAVINGYTTITPLHFDTTADKELTRLNAAFGKEI